ncbi:MAG: Gfo/Idh/MocA family protein, partial [Planctomycetota bacterium]
HDIDFLRWLLGDVAEVCAQAVASNRKRPAFDDCLSANLKLARGIPASIQASWGSALRASRHGVICTGGAVFVEGPRPFHPAQVRAAKAGAEAAHVYEFAGDSQGHAEACAHFVDCIRGDASLEIPIADGLRALEVSVALLESSASGGAKVAVRLDG